MEFKEAPKNVIENLKKFKGRQISEEEFNFNNAIVMVEDIKNMRFKPYPSKPQEIKDYYEIKKKALNASKPMDLKKIQQDYLNTHEVKEYFKRYSEVEAKNSGNYYWLHWCRKVLGSDFYTQIDPIIEEYRLKDDNVRKYSLNL